MNVFNNAYYIRSCFWKAGMTYKWPRELGMVGIGIAADVITKMPEKFMIKAYKNYYEVDKVKLREHYKKYKQDIYNARGCIILVIPRRILFDWGVDMPKEEK